MHCPELKRHPLLKANAVISNQISHPLTTAKAEYGNKITLEFAFVAFEKSF